MNLDRSINKLSQRLNNLYPDVNNNGPGYWKGKRIIPTNQWIKITNTINKTTGKYCIKEALHYFPDSYIKYVFPFGIPDHLQEEANKWYSDYLELMEQRRDPEYGSTKCYECLLCPHRDESALLFGIHKVIARGLEQEKEEVQDADPIYPCSTVNRFECPYDKKQALNVNSLFVLGMIAHAVDKAFLKAYSMTKSNETVYDADFVADQVKEINTLYDGRPHSWFLEYPIEEKLPQVEKLSIVPIRNVGDVYNALKDSETLAKILEQGLEEEYLSEKEFIIKLFMSIKDKIKKEDLTVYEPIFPSHVQKSKCTICEGYANIHCINCSNVWLCVNDWEHHKVNRHTLAYT